MADAEHRRSRAAIICKQLGLAKPGLAQLRRELRELLPSDPVAQGVAVNKSLHWLRCAVHDIVAHRPPQFRNSALTRLLQPSLSGYAAVCVLVNASVRPGVDSGRETLEAMQFGEAAGRVPLTPKRRTEMSSSGSLSKLPLAWLPRMAGGETLCLWTRSDTLYS